MAPNAWRRVNRTNVCQICGRDNWCLISADGSAAICPRVASPKRCGEAGYLHRLADAPVARSYSVRSIRLTTAGPDLASLAAQYRAALDPGRLHQFACQIGVSVSSLTALSVGW